MNSLYSILKMLKIPDHIMKSKLTLIITVIFMCSMIPSCVQQNTLEQAATKAQNPNDTASFSFSEDGQVEYTLIPPNGEVDALVEKFNTLMKHSSTTCVFYSQDETDIHDQSMEIAAKLIHERGYRDVYNRFRTIFLQASRAAQSSCRQRGQSTAGSSGTFFVKEQAVKESKELPGRVVSAWIFSGYNPKYLITEFGAKYNKPTNWPELENKNLNLTNMSDEWAWTLVASIFHDEQKNTKLFDEYKKWYEAGEDINLAILIPLYNFTLADAQKIKKSCKNISYSLANVNPYATEGACYIINSAHGLQIVDRDEILFEVTNVKLIINPFEALAVGTNIQESNTIVKLNFEVEKLPSENATIQFLARGMKPFQYTNALSQLKTTPNLKVISWNEKTKSSEMMDHAINIMKDMK